MHYLYMYFTKHTLNHRRIRHSVSSCIPKAVACFFGLCRYKMVVACGIAEYRRWVLSIECVIKCFFVDYYVCAMYLGSEVKFTGRLPLHKPTSQALPISFRTIKTIHQLKVCICSIYSGNLPSSSLVSLCSQKGSTQARHARVPSDQQTQSRPSNR